MKPGRSTTILLNLVLILVSALLLRSLISVPSNASASQKWPYEIVSDVQLESSIDEYWKQGWKLNSFSWDPKNDTWKIVYER